MIADSVREDVKKAALELVQAESGYLKAKAKFEMLLLQIQEGAKTIRRSRSPELPLPQGDAAEPGTVRFLNALPADGTPISSQQIAAILGKDSRWVSATGSNLSRTPGRIEKAGTGMWRRVLKKG